MLGLEQYGLPLQVAAVVIPAAVYFLLLGLLNSQRTPQLLRSRTDFILLILAFSLSLMIVLERRWALNTSAYSRKILSRLIKE